jgi:hypothetical protein
VSISASKTCNHSYARSAAFCSTAINEGGERLLCSLLSWIILAKMGIIRPNILLICELLGLIKINRAALQSLTSRKNDRKRNIPQQLTRGVDGTSNNKLSARLLSKQDVAVFLVSYWDN